MKTELADMKKKPDTFSIRGREEEMEKRRRKKMEEGRNEKRMRRKREEGRKEKRRRRKREEGRRFFFRDSISVRIKYAFAPSCFSAFG